MIKLNNLVTVAAITLATAGAGALLLNATPTAAAQSSTQASPEAEEKKAQRPDLVAIQVHADWCSACVKIAPHLEEARAELAEDNVLFFVADRTDPENKQAELFFGAMDLDELWFEVGRKTGLLHLVNPETGEVVQTIRGYDVDSAGQLVSAIRNHADG